MKHTIMRVSTFLVLLSSCGTLTDLPKGASTYQRRTREKEAPRKALRTGALVGDVLLGLQTGNPILFFVPASIDFLTKSIYKDIAEDKGRPTINKSSYIAYGVGGGMDDIPHKYIGFEGLLEENSFSVCFNFGYYYIHQKNIYNIDISYDFLEPVKPIDSDIYDPFFESPWKNKEQLQLSFLKGRYFSFKTTQNLRFSLLGGLSYQRVLYPSKFERVRSLSEHGEFYEGSYYYKNTWRKQHYIGLQVKTQLDWIITDINGLSLFTEVTINKDFAYAGFGLQFLFGKMRKYQMN